MVEQKSKIQVLRMKFSIVAVVPMSDDAVSKLPKPPNSHMEGKNKTSLFVFVNPMFPISPMEAFWDS